jgi:hypothetical protein
MSGFSDREKAFEDKFTHDKDIALKIEGRASKLFGLWAAEKMGLSGDEAIAYSLGIVNANFKIPGFDDVLQKVTADFTRKNVHISEHLMKVELEKALKEAKSQILKE